MTEIPITAPHCFGGLATLDGDGRLLVPVELRQTVLWLKGKKPIRLLAELRRRGRIRFHPLDHTVNRLAELRSLITETHPQKIEALAALGDRYREVSYYPSDTRIHLPPAIHVYLDPQDASRDTYYIETRGDHLDVMTLAERDQRLSSLVADLELPELQARLAPND